MSMLLNIGLVYDVAPVSRGNEPIATRLSETADESLVARAQEGDFIAFEELVRRYRNDVYALAYHYVRDREEAWDLAQEVFIKAHRGLKRFRGDSSFKTWILRITANRCKDFFKKRRLRTVSFDETLKADDHPTANDGPSKALAAKELGQAIEDALETLPDKHKAAFMLREYEGLSYEEMAGVMECSLGTVMSRLHHARKKMQAALIAMGVVERNPS